MRQEETQLLRDGALMAAQGIAFNTTGDVADLITYRAWRDTMHRILMADHCPCTEGRDQDCFLHIAPEIQVGLYAAHPMLSLEAFTDIVMSGLHAAFLDELESENAPAN
ncbi:MAG: hypothetical protein P9L99_09640 [Candidatus Lernaella stagnicola]|nr:hypothetical protein [Candidatus Lernaella stagnicola]